MPSDYEQISAENTRKYGTDIDLYGPILLGNRYADPMHFVFELLQNAEDALARQSTSGQSRRVRFALASGAVHLSHFGEPFTDEDVRGVCGIVEGTKEHDLTAIGHFGIGFKSVYAITDSPAIHSGDEQFAIKDYVHPFAVPATALDEGETVIALPLKEGTLADDVIRQLGRLGPERTLLFLREIDEIEWNADGGASGYCQRKETAESEGVRRVILRSKSESADPLEESWLVFAAGVEHAGRPAGDVELAFKIATDDSGKDMIEAVNDFRFVAFFPTEIPTHLGMLIHGPYRTTPSRDNIPHDDEWNRHLVDETAKLLVQALRYLRDHDLLGVHVFDALPLSRQGFASHFAATSGAAMFDAVRQAVAREPLLPAYRGGYVAATQARLTPNKGLRHLLSRHQLTDLLGEEAPVSWLTGDITQTGTPKLHKYLTEEHGVAEIGIEDLLRHLDGAFLERQSDVWICRLYSFLDRERVHEHRWHYWSTPLEHIPLIRLEDGTHVGHKSNPRPYLPTDPPSDVERTVCPAVCSTKPALAFLLKSLGLSEPDRIDVLIRNIRPKYRTQEDIKDTRYAKDLRIVVATFKDATQQRQRDLAKEIRELFFVKTVDAGTGEISFSRPPDVYLPTKQLSALFASVPTVLFPTNPPRGVRKEDLYDLLETCGASQRLAPVKSDGWSRFTEHERLRMRIEAGYRRFTYEDSLLDFNFRGLEELLLDILPSLPAEEAAGRPALLWNALREAADRRDHLGFKGTYTWFRYKRRSAHFDSAAVALLNEAAWVPDGAGGLRQPSEVEFASLGWTPDPFLERSISFRPPTPQSSLATFAKEVGIDADMLTPTVLDAMKRAKEAGLSDEAIARHLDELSRPHPPPKLTDGALEQIGGGMASTPRERAGVAPPGGRGEATTVGAGQGRETTHSGASSANSGAGGRNAFTSYIAVGHDHEDGDGGEGSAEYARRQQLEEAAIALILEREPALTRTARNNPGYDLYEDDENGNPMRWIEVKALTGDWQSRPVTLTHTQFDFAREKGSACSLYVVEHAGTDDAEIVKINDPAGRESTYTFDNGWRVVADPSPDAT